MQRTQDPGNSSCPIFHCYGSVTFEQVERAQAERAVPVETAEDKWQSNDVMMWELKSVDSITAARRRSHSSS